MKLNRFILVSVFFVFPFLGTGQHPLSDQISNHTNNGELFVRYNLGNNMEVPPEWPPSFSIDRVAPDNAVYGYVTTEAFLKWISGNPASWEVLPHPSTEHIPTMKGTVDIHSIDEWDFYPTYEAYVDMMHQFAEDFPDLCRLENIGQSEEGRALLAVVISDQDETDGAEPLFLYTATIHGDETAGYVLFLRLIHYLLNEYGIHPLVTELVNNLEIWINPLANPDGTYAGGNQSVFGATRFNANGVDLNRNFPDPEDGEHPDGNPWQMETISFMELAENHQFLMSSNIHGGEEVFNYPWDTWSQLPADDAWWNFVGREWVDTVYAHAPAGYFSGFNNGVTNGYQWYSINGGRQDYMNYFEHCREVTLEISGTKLLPAEQLPQFWEYNHRSFLNYMKQALYGIQGQITDAETGEALEASVFVENHDADRSWVVSNASGMFFRPIFEGTYDLTFFRPGYALKTIEEVNILNYSVTHLDVQLAPTESDVEQNALSSLFTIGNNPGNGQFMLACKGTHSAGGSYILLDETGKKVLEGDLTKGSDENYYIIDIQDKNDGLYFLHVRTENKQGTFKLIKQ